MKLNWLWKFRKSVVNIKIQILIEITFWIISLLAIGFIISLILSGFLFTNKNIDITIAAQIGDFFGGIIGPLLSFLSILYLIENLKLIKKGNFIVEKKNIQDQIEKFKGFLESENLKLLQSSFNIEYKKFLDGNDFNFHESKINLIDFCNFFEKKSEYFSLCVIIYNSFLTKLIINLTSDQILDEVNKSKLLKLGARKFNSNFFLMLEYLNSNKIEITSNFKEISSEAILFENLKACYTLYNLFD